MGEKIMEDKITKLQNLIDNSQNIVFFGGAGVSTESGLKDFRSVDGLYHMKYDYPPETILSHSFFYENTKEFYRFYFDKLLVDGIKPNAAHKKLVELEKAGKLKAIVTQNIDGLHQLAGSKCVYELHGTVAKNRCERCRAFYNVDYIKSFNGDVPTCKCGGTIKPEVVLYEEGLDQNTVNKAVKAIASSDLLIVAGTSLTVYPASGLIRFFGGKNLVVINKDDTINNDAIGLIKDALFIKGKVGEVLSKIVVNISE